MNFEVPQFIEIEDKIFGPLSFKQFMYLIGGGGLAFLFYTLPVPLMVKFIPMAGAIGLGVALAFYKVNERPFILTMEAGLRYFFGKKLYLWEKKETKITNVNVIQVQTGATAGTAGGDRNEKLSKSKLDDLTWSLDIKENIK
jgi:hypothetical protein